MDPWSKFCPNTQSKGYCLQDRKLHLTPLYRAVLTFGVNGPKETSNTLIPLIYLMPQKLRDTGHTNLIGLWVTFSSILIMIQWTLVEVMLSLPLSCKLLNINSFLILNASCKTFIEWFLNFFFQGLSQIVSTSSVGQHIRFNPGCSSWDCSVCCLKLNIQEKQHRRIWACIIDKW